MRPSRHFSDWFNPMLVRDLRQGLRSRLFTFFFLLLQGGMVFYIVLQLSSQTGVNSATGHSLGALLFRGLAWFYYGVMPLLACFAFGAEFRDGRLDLLKLTQLHARQLVLGKWTSLVMQMLLVTVSLLPYLVLRYFIGGVDLAAELGALALMLVGSIEVLAICLAIACLGHVAVRLVATTGLMLLLYNGAMGLMISGQRGSLQVAPADYPVTAILLAGLGLPAVWLAVEFAAARLAPASENHDTPVRWVLPLLLISAWVAAWMKTEVMMAYLAFVSLQILWVLLLAVAREPSPFPSTYAPFVSWGIAGRLVGRFLLYPGWPSAVFLTLAGCGLLGWIYLFALEEATLEERRDLLVNLALLPGTLLFPQVVGWLVPARGFPAGVRYGVLLTVCIVIAVTVLIFGGNYAGAEVLRAALCLLPPCAWVLLGFGQITPTAGLGVYDFASVAALAGNVPTLIAAVVGSVHCWRFFRVMERQAADQLRFGLRGPLPPAPAHPPPPLKLAEAAQPGR